MCSGPQWGRRQQEVMTNQAGPGFLGTSCNWFAGGRQAKQDPCRDGCDGTQENCDRQLVQHGAMGAVDY